MKKTYMNIVKCIALALLIICAYMIYVYIFSHKYIYISKNDTVVPENDYPVYSKGFYKVSEIQELYLHAPSSLTINNLQYCENLDILCIDIDSKDYNGDKTLGYLKNLHVKKLQLIGDWNDYSGLQYQTDLEGLTIFAFNFNNEDLAYIYDLNKLKYLKLLFMEDLDDISDIDCLESLQEVYFYNVNIKDYSPLLKCNNLKYVRSTSPIPESIVTELENRGIVVELNKNHVF